MAKGRLKVATCQFAVSRSIRRNAGWIERFMAQAQKAGAEVVHFSECALSGYPGVDMESLAGFDWELLRSETRKVMQRAAQLKLWVVLGSIHELTSPHKPHNSLYLINSAGAIVDRYDKRFCTPGDLQHFTVGDRFVTFKIKGVKCAVLICYDLRFPELYRELQKLKVECLFQSFHNARAAGRTVHTDIMRQSMQCRAATNYFWVSMTNSSAYYNMWPSCFIRPDGKIVGQLKFHRPGLMCNTVDVGQSYYDPSAPFRARAMKGVLRSGAKVSDPRSRRTTVL